MSDQTSKKTAKVGDTVDVKEGGSVQRPDTGQYATVVVGGSYVLDVPGVFVVDGTEITAK